VFLDFPGALLRFTSSPDRLTHARDDSALMRDLRANQTAAFGALYERHAGSVFGLVHRIVRDHAAAEDVTQEAFVQLWRHRQAYAAERGAPRAWLMTIARNRALDSLRRHSGRLEPLDSEHESREAAERPEDEVLRRDEAATLNVALSRLPETQRTVVELVYFGGLTQAEIAGQLRVPLGTIKSRMRLGLLKLAAALEPSAAATG
jgi:RNA polymerase sigma-70 factor (ECF subfamily)